MVCQVVKHVDWLSHFTSQGTGIHTASLQDHGAPRSAQNEAGGFSLIGEGLQTQDFSERVQSILMSSWRPATRKQYGTYISRWITFSRERGINPHAPVLKYVLEFLAQLYENGLQYSALNTARSALSAISQTNEQQCWISPFGDKIYDGDRKSVV